MKTAVIATMLAAGLAACSTAPPAPAELDTRNEACANCRMTVSSAQFASQIVAPGEEALFFDDLGCLSRYVKKNEVLPAGAIAYVSDHRTSEWVRASQAVFTRVPSLQTPMNSHLIAHASESSRDADPAASGGEPVARADVAGRLAEGTGQ